MPTSHARPTWAVKARRWLQGGGWWVFVGAMVILAAVLLFVDSRRSEANEVTAVQDAQLAYSQRDATAQRALTLADQILEACQNNSIPIEYAGACNTAEDVSREPVAVVQGPTGETGPRGLQGVAGLRGEKGDKGERGDTGEKGETGDKGDKGDAGEQGPRGIAGNDGANGVNGQPGKDGADGKDGDPGCLPGTSPEPYLYPDGRSGSRCVEPEGP